LRVWSIANQTAGVGKTTASIVLGRLLAARGHQTLLLDLDPRGSLTSRFEIDPDSISSSIHNLFLDAAAKKRLEPSVHIVPTLYAGLSILPASTSMAALEGRIGTGNGMGWVISRSLKALGDAYDYALIDTAPIPDMLMVNAFAACEHLIVPVSCESLALDGLKRMLKVIEMINKSRQDNLRFTVVPTLFDRRSRASVKALRELRERHPERIWKAAIPVESKLRGTSRTSAPLFDFISQSPAVNAYDKLLGLLLTIK